MAWSSGDATGFHTYCSLLKTGFNKAMTPEAKQTVTIPNNTAVVSPKLKIAP